MQALAAWSSCNSSWEAASSACKRGFCGSSRRRQRIRSLRCSATFHKAWAQAAAVITASSGSLPSFWFCCCCCAGRWLSVSSDSVREDTSCATAWVSSAAGRPRTKLPKHLQQQPKSRPTALHPRPEPILAMVLTLLESYTLYLYCHFIEANESRALMPKALVGCSGVCAACLLP